MFVLPPQSPFLPPKCDLFHFGDPENLKAGVKLVEKGNTSKEKIIHSLYEMDLNIKYVTEQGNIIKRVSDTQIITKKKSSKVLPNGASNGTSGLQLQTNSSLPMAIPLSGSFKS